MNPRPNFIPPDDFLDWPPDEPSQFAALEHHPTPWHVVRRGEDGAAMIVDSWGRSIFVTTSAELADFVVEHVNDAVPGARTVS